MFPSSPNLLVSIRFIPQSPLFLHCAFSLHSPCTASRHVFGYTIQVAALYFAHLLFSSCGCKLPTSPSRLFPNPPGSNAPLDLVAHIRIARRPTPQNSQPHFQFLLKVVRKRRCPIFPPLARYIQSWTAERSSNSSFP